MEDRPRAERLSNGWTLIHHARETAVGVDLVVIRPREGVMLLEFDPLWNPGAPERFGASLEAAGFSHGHPGHLPVLHRHFRAADLPLLSDLLLEAFIWARPITLPETTGWDRAAAEIVLASATPRPAPPPLPVATAPPEPIMAVVPPAPLPPREIPPTPPPGLFRRPGPAMLLGVAAGAALVLVIGDPEGMVGRTAALRDRLLPRAAPVEGSVVLASSVSTSGMLLPRAEAEPAAAPTPALSAMAGLPLAQTASAGTAASAETADGRTAPPAAGQEASQESSSAAVALPEARAEPLPEEPPVAAAAAHVPPEASAPASRPERFPEEPPVAAAAPMPTENFPGAAALPSAPAEPRPDPVPDPGSAGMERAAASADEARTGAAERSEPFPEEPPVAEATPASAQAAMRTVPSEPFPEEPPVVEAPPLPEPAQAAAPPAPPPEPFPEEPPVAEAPPLPPARAAAAPAPPSRPPPPESPPPESLREEPPVAEAPPSTPAEAVPARPAVSAAPAPVAPTLPAAAPPASSPPASSPPASSPPASSPPASPPPAPRQAAPALAPEMLAVMLRRGEALLAQGDVSGARRFLERAALGGSAPAALALAETHDPARLAARNVRGLRPDPEAALRWYRHAAALGADGLDDRIRDLERNTR